MKYLDGDGTGVEQKHYSQKRMRYTSGGNPIQEIWDRHSKIARDNFGRKIKPTGFIYLPRKKLREAGGHLSIRSCLQDAVINYAPRIVKYINKLELYRNSLLEE